VQTGSVGGGDRGGGFQGNWEILFNVKNGVNGRGCRENCAAEIPTSAISRRIRDIGV